MTDGQTDEQDLPIKSPHLRLKTLVQPIILSQPSSNPNLN